MERASAWTVEPNRAVNRFLKLISGSQPYIYLAQLAVLDKSVSHRLGRTGSGNQAALRQLEGAASCTVTGRPM